MRAQVRVGDDLDLEIALVNAGKAPAQLIKINEIIPEGFEVRRAPDICARSVPPQDRGAEACLEAIEHGNLQYEAEDPLPG